MDNVFAPSAEERAAIVSIDAAFTFANIEEAPLRESIVAALGAPASLRDIALISDTDFDAALNSIRLGEGEGVALSSAW